jgi:hypothetical protein
MLAAPPFSSLVAIYTSDVAVAAIGSEEIALNRTRMDARRPENDSPTLA